MIGCRPSWACLLWLHEILTTLSCQPGGQNLQRQDRTKGRALGGDGPVWLGQLRLQRPLRAAGRDLPEERRLGPACACNLQDCQPVITSVKPFSSRIYLQETLKAVTAVWWPHGRRSPASAEHLYFCGCCIRPPAAAESRLAPAVKGADKAHR